ncbi:MAG: 50S ribosomal protein L13 [Rickettsiales bacterium]|nr:50S ribosomal protein L13 [Rickettsiales bacterium]|tara:strand:+ start:771 stop:1214 length:444 start_codon:yes stop_codon:yes gene_type:complete
MKTWVARKEDVNSGAIERKWFVVDAEGQTLGRISTHIAMVLRGRHKAIYTPHVDVGDFVVVINAAKVKVTGSKRKTKKYYNYSGYPGGLRAWTFEDLIEKDPKRVILHAVKGMLPKNRLAAQQLRKLKVYAGSEHPHSAQKPESLSF